MEEELECPHGTVWCDLVDKPCLMEMNMECDTYKDWLRDNAI